MNRSASSLEGPGLPDSSCPPATASSRAGTSPTCRRRRRSTPGNLFKIIGPGAIMAATSIGGGEWLVGPAAAVKYSSSIFLIATVAILLQVIFNLEAIRYTLYTGEPIYGGIMRLKPGAEVLGRLLHRDRVLPAWLAGARRQRRGDADGRVDGTHAGRARSGGAGLGRHGPHARSSC